MSSKQVFVTRQGIYNRLSEVFAYELIFNDTINVDSDHSSNVRDFIGNVVEIGLDNLAGRRPAIINLDSELQLDETLFQLSTPQIILGISPTTPVSDENIEKLLKLKGHGYKLLLNDFVYSQERAELLKHADIVRIQVGIGDLREMMEAITPIREAGVEILADGVDSRDVHARCVQLGFSYFRGNFLCQPNIVEGKRLASNRTTALRLIASLQAADVSNKEIETLISQDVTLSYKLLRHINSAFFALPREIESIKQAIVYLGLQAIKQWATLISLTNVDDKPSELMNISMLRGKMCELLAEQARLPQPAGFFTAGLFSTLDAIMDADMGELLEQLPLSQEIKDALLKREGAIGEAINCVIAYEQSDWEKSAFQDLDPWKVATTYTEALSWSDSTLAALPSG